MNKIDLCIAGFAAVGLLIWIRGSARKTISDSILGLVLAAIAAAAYFFVFSLFHLNGRSLRLQAELLQRVCFE